MSAPPTAQRTGQRLRVSLSPSPALTPPSSSPSLGPGLSRSSPVAPSFARQSISVLIPNQPIRPARYWPWNEQSAPTARPPVQPAKPWPCNEQDTALIRAGYQPAWDPSTTSPATNINTPETGPAKRKRKKKTVRFDMAEPRARAARHKGQMNFGPESMSTYSGVSTKSTWRKLANLFC